MSDIDPAAVMAAHVQHGYLCDFDQRPDVPVDHCEPYLLAKAASTEPDRIRAAVVKALARVRVLLIPDEDGDSQWVDPDELRRALDDAESGADL